MTTQKVGIVALNAAGTLTMEHALLGLVRAQPMHGYEILQQITHQAGLGLIWRVKQSHLYALLAKLEGLGLLAATLEPQGTKPPRRILRLTAAGEAAFATWLAAPVKHGRDFRQEFLAKLFFAVQAGPSTARDLIARQRAACQQWPQRFNAPSSADATDLFPQLVQQFRWAQTSAILAWLDQCEASLTGSALPAS